MGWSSEQAFSTDLFCIAMEYWPTRIGSVPDRSIKTYWGIGRDIRKD